MPVDLDSSATFEDLILRLAVRTGNASETGSVSAIPSDDYRLDRMKKCVNEGYTRFLRAYTRWTFLDYTLTLTLDPDGTGPLNIEQDAGRYRLPIFVSGSPRGPWSYADTRTARMHVQNVAPSQVLGYRQIGAMSTGVPSVAACRPIETGDKGGGQTRGWEVLFWPIPDTAYVLSAPFRVKSHKLVELTDRHVAGSDHDDCITAFAAMVWYEDDAPDPEKLARTKAAIYGVPGTAERGLLAESIDLDTQHQPDEVGPNDGRGGSNCSTRLPRVATHNGATVAYD